MISKIKTLFSQKAEGSAGDTTLPIFLTLFFVVLPIIVISVFLCVREYNQQTNLAVASQAKLAEVEASFIHGKLDGVVDLGISLASHPQTYSSIMRGDWSGTINEVENASRAFPYIRSVSFFDEKGVLKASIPPTPELVGKSFDHQDYYQGVSKEWKPYISPVSRRASKEGRIVSVAVPIKFNNENEKVLGFLVLLTRLDKATGWVEETNISSDVSTYIVDKNSRIVAPQNLKFGDNFIGYSSASLMQKLYNRERGVEIIFNPSENKEKLVAYNPVEGYGFGVAVTQSASVAFAERRSKVAEYIAFWVLITFLFGLSSYRIIKGRAEMRRQRDRERMLLNSIGDGVIAINRNWDITLWNKAASVITGWQEEDVLGKPFRSIIKFIRERDRSENITFIEDAIVFGKITEITEHTLLVKKNGSEVPVGDSAAPIMGLHGDVGGAIIIFRNLSREREESRLHSDFAYASHQIRTPVTEALWNLETAMKENDTEKRKEDLLVVHNSLESIQRLAEHLISVSGVDQGNVIPSLSSVKLLDMLTDIQKGFEQYAKKRNVSISITPVSPLVAVNTDPSLLKKVLSEVVWNAVLYSGEGGVVEITTTMNEQEILFGITDHGVGIPLEEQPIVFTKFFRGSNRGSRTVGAGLGLFIAKAYIKLLGGKIWFTSEEGAGTTFYVSVPLK